MKLIIQGKMIPICFKFDPCKGIKKHEILRYDISSCSVCCVSNSLHKK